MWFTGKYNKWDKVDPAELFSQAPTEKKEANPKLNMVKFLQVCEEDELTKEALQPLCRRWQQRSCCTIICVLVHIWDTKALAGSPGPSFCWKLCSPTGRFYVWFRVPDILVTGEQIFCFYNGSAKGFSQF